MRTKELLLQCKIKLGLQSDYKLAQALEIERQRISDYMNGKKHPDTYAIVRIAECLKLDPLELIAEYGMATAKRAQEVEFWRGFLGRVGKRTAGYMLALVFTLSCVVGQGETTNRAGGFSRRFRYA